MNFAVISFAILLTAHLSHSSPGFLKRQRRAVSVTFLDMLVRSEGCDDPGKPPNSCGNAKILVSGKDYSLHKRGHNIVVVDATSGIVLDKRNYDTHGVSSSGYQMRDYLNSINGEDKIILISTQDDATHYWHPAKAALIKLGVTEPILKPFRGSFAFVGYAGVNKPSWIAQEQRARGQGPSVIHLRIPLQQSPPEPRMNIFVRSEGCSDPGRTECGRAFITVNRQGYSLHSRGVNVVVFSAEGVFLQTRAFDTHSLRSVGFSATDYLNGLSGERIVLIAFQDEASVYGGPVIGAMERLGMTRPITFGARTSFALIGYAGSYKPSWITQAHAPRGLGPSMVTASIEPVNVLDIHIRSEGCNDPNKTQNTCGIAFIYVNGVDRSPRKRGHNVVVLDGRTGAVIKASAFDTHVDASAGINLANYLNGLVGDYIVLVAVQDEGSKHIGPAVAALRTKGAKGSVVPEDRGSFAFAGYSRVNKPSWVTQAMRPSAKGPSEIRIKVPLILPPYENIGCYKDTGNRAIPTLEGKDPILDGGYQARINAIHKCYEAAKRRGYRIFALQHSGWCASSSTAEFTYDKYGKYDACASDGEGGPWANQVYFIRDSVTNYGCFRDTGNRAIPTIEGSDPVLDGNYKVRRNAISKCAVATLQKRYGVFAVQDGGWCAASKTAGNTFDKYGKSDACNEDGKGGGWANNVYLIECQGALGMESRTIKNAQITASSEWDQNHAAIQGRLNFQKSGIKQGAWSARSNDKNQWLQIDLQAMYTKVTAVASQGRHQSNQWVTKYTLQFSNDGISFQNYREEGQTVDEEFTANMDADSIVYHRLNPSIMARYIRFRPVNWNNHISMRVEVFGCKQECQSALGVESGAIPDSQMSASSQWDGNHAAKQGRLFFKSTTKASSWSAKTNNANQWLQVHLRVYTRVTRVASQGRHAVLQWVTKYKLQYSIDGNTFHYFIEAGQSADKEFAGNSDGDTVVYHALTPPINARYIRFQPIQWFNHISMRVEVYGCIQEVNECLPNPCLNGATCINRVGGYRCNCAPGYTGGICQTDINECSPNPCQNGATCVNLVGSYRCTCAPGYTGGTCQTDINECSPNPCQNGATCVNLVGSYRCNCASGYTGGTCQTDINDCSPNPCQNGASCVDLVGNYRCNCAAGYTGNNCETDLNKCASNHCENGATCVNHGGSYQCICAPGYVGATCEVAEVDECDE
ncbi:uncharacterized protein LOC114963329 isoform X1 [Acropora millepora]|uniref:uncharacterized protein LOC114963329 isoform X1 n=1 Tax=Acropora millepora TaxID=45264 RepID=UPI001CF2D504|nr:uncharacterized protein LOC114963329 isoform X1 [Acropora millepora]